MPDELKIEGEDSEDWMLLDMGHIMLHVFLPEARAHYNLDSMWRGEDPEVERIVRYFPTEDEGEGENEMLMELEDVHPHRSNTAELIKESIRSRHSTPRYM